MGISIGKVDVHHNYFDAPNTGVFVDASSDNKDVILSKLQELQSDIRTINPKIDELLDELSKFVRIGQKDKVETIFEQIGKITLGEVPGVLKKLPQQLKKIFTS